MQSDVALNEDVQKLLHGWRDGDSQARDKLFDRLYVELRKLSSSILRGEGHISLSTGDLVNEAVMRLIGLKYIDWQDKAHFMALASRMMRRVLVEHARKKNANKRDHQKVTLVTQVVGANAQRMDNQLLEHALIRLQALDKERAEIVEMRYYGGLSLEEIAEVIGKSPSTIKRNWRASRAWLVQAISESRPT
jgi:RNA polymerase sigma factor (TIGR02999 family)